MEFGFIVGIKLFHIDGIHLCNALQKEPKTGPRLLFCLFFFLYGLQDVGFVFSFKYFAPVIFILQEI